MNQVRHFGYESVQMTPLLIGTKSRELSFAMDGLFGPSFHKYFRLKPCCGILLGMPFPLFNFSLFFNPQPTE